MTEEDYANDGDELDCDLTGEISSWYIPTLDHDTYLDGVDDNPFAPDQGTIELLDSFHPVRDGEGSPIAPPADAFCSAHWFDYHETGLMAQGYYSAGFYLIDVRDPANLTTYGYATARPSEVWDAYWFPLRDENGVETGHHSNFVMTADNVRGVDVFMVDVPAEVISENVAAPAPNPAPEPEPAPEPAPSSSPLPATGGGLVIVALGAWSVATKMRRRHEA